MRIIIENLKTDPLWRLGAFILGASILSWGGSGITGYLYGTPTATQAATIAKHEKRLDDQDVNFGQIREALSQQVAVNNEQRAALEAAVRLIYMEREDRIRLENRVNDMNRRRE